MIFNQAHAMFAHMELFINRDQQFEELDTYFKKHINESVN